MHSLKAVFIAYCASFFFLYCFSTSSIANNWSDNLYLNGYFTLDVSLADSDLATVSSAGEMRQFSADSASVKNSLLGAQLEYQFNDNFSLFAQGLAFYDEQGSTATDINWAYVSYDLGNDINARAGLFQTPFLQGTELRSIGYSRLWARPLTPGTGASGINQYKGLDVIKRLSSGEYNWELQLALGQGEHDLDEVAVDDLALIAAKIQRDSFWLRAALMHAQYDVFTPRGQLIIDAGEVLMASVEMEFEFNQLLINLGYSTSDSEVTPNDTMHYLSLAYRLNDITPFVMMAKRNQFFEAFDVPTPPEGGAGPPPAGPPPSERPPTPDGNADIYSIGVGLRWDFAEQFAFKVQYEDIRTSDDSGRINSIEQSDGNLLTVVIEGAF